MNHFFNFKLNSYESSSFNLLDSVRFDWGRRKKSMWVHKNGKVSGEIPKDNDLKKAMKKLRIKEGMGEQKLREAIRKIIREDFAGAYPEHQRKKFDNTRRKQSEVLGYKLTGKNDVKTEIDDATIKEGLKNVVKEVMNEIDMSNGWNININI